MENRIEKSLKNIENTIEKREIVIPSNCDQLPICAVMFIPNGKVKGIFQISHGMAEHKERYFSFMQFLAEQGYVTVINDHRGHGESIRTAEDLGYFYDDKADYIVEDLHQITLYVKKLYPKTETVLFGHSMGSMVVRKYIKKYDKEIDKLIVCGSPSRNPFAALAIFTVRLMKRFKGDRHRSNFIQNLAFGSYNKNIENAKSENAWICANEDTVEQYDRDALCGFVFTLNGFQNLFLLMKEIYQKDGWMLQNEKLPILFIAGSDDPVIINERKWLESQQFLKELGYTNVTGKLYPKLRHEILNEKDTTEIYRDIMTFLNAAKW